MDEPVDRAVEGEDVQLPRGVLGERRDSQAGVHDLHVIGHLLAIVPECPYLAGTVVAVDVGPVQRRES